VLAFKLQEMIVNKLEKIQPGVTYTVIAGSILTCNISNFNNFWNSNEVIARLDEIRNGMKSPFFEKTYE
jgi:C4-dicarboxylate transporter